MQYAFDNFMEIKIGQNTFNKCSLLAQITIPFSVTLIGEKSFSSCTSLTILYILYIKNWRFEKIDKYEKCSAFVEKAMNESEINKQI